ncbi:hypothetical protein ACQUFC_17855, partial [Enterococcus casseliflavus]
DANFTGNQAVGGNATSTGGLGQGGGAFGGAIGIFGSAPNLPSSLTLADVRLTGNVATGGHGAPPTEFAPAGPGGDASGGGLYALDAAIDATR